MILTAPRDSLQTKLLAAVIVCVVVPLAAVGAWLTSTAPRSGELLLRSRLDSTASRAATIAQTNWRQRRSDVLFLADNEPMRAALRDTIAALAPAFVRRAYETMPSVVRVVVRDRSGRVRWTLGETSPALDARGSANPPGVNASSPLTTLAAAVNDSDGRPALGEVETAIRLDALTPAVIGAEAPSSEFLAVHDRRGDGWLRPLGLPISLLDADHFTWNDHRWLAVRHSLTDPPIDVVAAAQLDPFLMPFARTARVGAIALALAAVVVTVLAVIVTGRLTQSLGTLAAAADRVSLGDLDARIDTASGDEVGRVARAFNEMIGNLQRMMRELSQREAVAAMGELAATLAHQLRSPATAMRLDLERAHDKLPIGSNERALLARSLEQLERLERAIAGSIKVARGAGADFSELDIREPLRRAISVLCAEYESSGVHVDERGISDAPLIGRGNAAALEQMFTNLLANAAQAAGSGGRVTVSGGARNDSHTTISIADNGPGMSPDVCARAGEPFFSTKPQGTGLGLAIARRIAVAHGGGLGINSTEGAGTIVRIDLPAVRA